MAQNSGILKNITSDTELQEIIYKALQEAFQKLIEEKRKQKGTLVFSENGKIVRYSPQ